MREIKKLKSILFFVLLFALLLQGCSFKKEEEKKGGITQEKNIQQELSSQGEIKKFNNLDELKSFFAENIDNNYQRGSFYGNGEIMVDSVAPMQTKELAVNEETALGMGTGSSDYSETNVQVQGVDEADIIKTDGAYIYAVSKNDLFIIDAYPAENSEIISKIEFKSRPENIYVNGDNLIIYGRDNQIFEEELYRDFRQQSNYSFLKIFNISDKKNPTQERDLKFEGNYSDSRMIGDYLYFVTKNYNYYMGDEPVLPGIFENGENLKKDCSLLDCSSENIYYFDMPYDSYEFTSISAINIKDKEEDVNRDIYLMSSSQNMYVSKDNIYITYTKYINENELVFDIVREIVFPLLSSEDQNKILVIEKVENFVLSKEEKYYKIESIFERFTDLLSEDDQNNLEKKIEEAVKKEYKDISKELEKTFIYKINIDKNELTYQASGEVTGHVLNQFSMDENNGYFRIATTKNRTWSKYEEDNIKSYNNLYVLDGELNTVGFLEGLAEDERIYSVRFMQNRAYLVTFKQMDPLFVVDLADPKNPKVLGELKIPGYSDYLHPYDENTLIGLGKDTGETEWGGVRTKGVKLSLFDVSDVNNPSEIDTYILGDSGSNSIALSDHKAFLFSKEKNLLSIPVSIQEEISEPGRTKLTFSGAVVFEITKKGFKLKGKIDHSRGGSPSESDYWQGYSYYDNTVKRSLYINDVIYTFSNNYIKMNKLDDMKEIKDLKLEKEKKDDFIIIN